MRWSAGVGHARPAGVFTGMLKLTVSPLRTNPAAARTRSGVSSLSEPRSSLLPHRPQFETVSKSSLNCAKVRCGSSVESMDWQPRFSTDAAGQPVRGHHLVRVNRAAFSAGGGIRTSVPTCPSVAPRLGVRSGLLMSCAPSSDVLLLVRHGRTADNAAGLILGHRDTPLSKAGRAEAQRLAAELRSSGIAAVWTSPLRRARETAAIIAAPLALEPRMCAKLVESARGRWEGLAVARIAREEPALYAAFERGDPDFAFPGGESLREQH